MRGVSIPITKWAGLLLPDVLMMLVPSQMQKALSSNEQECEFGDLLVVQLLARCYFLSISIFSPVKWDNNVPVSLSERGIVKIVHVKCLKQCLNIESI